MHLHVLSGCAPAPLANYLKALGILRLVAEQADTEARGCWRGEVFCLLSRLTRGELEDFFLERYEPAPLVAPWGKGSGFFAADDPNLRPLEHSTAPRFLKFREGIAAARLLLDELSHADTVIRSVKARTKTTPNSFQSEEQRRVLAGDPIYLGVLDQLEREKSQDLEIARSLAQPGKPPTKALANALKASRAYKQVLAAAERRFKELKKAQIPDCRKKWRGPHAQWFSAAIVLEENGEPQFPSLLGTGGNDGRLDFTNSFMGHLGRLLEVGHASGVPRSQARELLREALWAEASNHLMAASIGQYQPGSAGGANSSTGFGGGNLVNSWDFLLMMEGSLLFTSRATKRFDPNAFSQASAPFVARPHAAGYASTGSEKNQRGEQWMPLWRQAATLQDVGSLLGEGRVQIHRQTANRPVDMARAISRLGVARGIESFVRYGYLERNGQSTLAVPLGRALVQHSPRVYLIDDLARWLDQLQLRSRDRNAPGRLVQAERRLADAVLAALTSDYTPARWQSILQAAVDVESLQATGTAIQAGPIPPLRPEWVGAVADGSPEVRLALALGSAAAGYTREGRLYDTVRSHWLPLLPDGRRFKTSDKRLVNDPRVVAHGRALLRDLVALVERRLTEAGMAGKRRSRLVAAPGCGAHLDDLGQFLTGSLDLEKLLGLARAFMAINWDLWKPVHTLRPETSGEPPDEGWLAVRLANLPWPLAVDLDIPADLKVCRLLASGDAVRAVELACQRLRSAGIRPPLQAGLTGPTTTLLWAAALAFPINRRTAVKAASLLDPSRKGTEMKGRSYA